jgi:hypothetical protein
MRPLPFGEKTPQMPQRAKNKRISSAIVERHGAFFVDLNFSRFAVRLYVCVFVLCLSVFCDVHAAAALFLAVSVSTVIRLSQI